MTFPVHRSFPLGYQINHQIFSVAGLIPAICQFGQQFFKYAKKRSIPFAFWLLSDKNLNFLKTSRCKSYYLLTYYKKNYFASAGHQTQDLLV